MKTSYRTDERRDKNFQISMTTEKSNETKGSIGRCIIQKEVVTLYNEEVKQKGHRADALALRAEERRDKLRKAMGRSKCP